MSELHQLLEVQSFDTRTDQLRHRLTHDPSVSARADAEASVAAVDRELAARRHALEAVRSVQRTHEREAAEHEAHANKVSAQLYGGSITAPKELEALQHEIGTIKDLQNAAEDRVIEQMELAEPIEAEIAAIEERHRLAREALEAAQVAVTVMEAEVGAELDQVAAERSAVAATVSELLLGAYERVRTTTRGSAVAVLGAGGKCEGCHLTLSRVDYDTIKRAPDDELVTCPECGRILVR